MVCVKGTIILVGALVRRVLPAAILNRIAKCLGEPLGKRSLNKEELIVRRIYPVHCVWQAGLAHFGSLFWPTPGTLKVWEIFLP